MKIILSHENADFDAVASMLGAYKLDPQSIPILPKNQHANVKEFLMLYKNGLPFVAWDDFDDGKAVQHITITDTARRLDVRNVRKDTPTVIIEHHPLKRELLSHETWAGEEVGAATTLLVEQIREQQIHVSSLEATLMALGIYADTGNFLYGGTTTRDIRAAAWLLEQGAVLDTVQRFLTSPLNQDQQNLLEQFMGNIDNRTTNGFQIAVCTTQIESIVSSINTVVGVLRDILDTDALIVLVAMPDHVQLIARSITDAIHVGQLATQFGGGGHPRAAAAAIHGAELETIREQVWHHLANNTKPSTRIAHLMSFGEIQTVNADDAVQDIITRIRRTGHEGYPVLENGQVTGLLTLRDADKALEHGLKNATVHDVMKSGSITLHHDDPVKLLEETMVSSDWGQIPIADGTGKLIGIVTRTDLIQHWGQQHAAQTSSKQQLDTDLTRQVIGEQTFVLVEKIALFAQIKGHYLYMVGGIARDILLRRANDDIDFVLEGDAIAFAEALQSEFGGTIHPYPPFGTATWHLDSDVAKVFGIDFTAIPDHLDFATARSELYEHPTALPTVYTSGIKLDLRRRDFTINTLAIQLSPERHHWQILDFYGGLADLDEKLIRVLHSLSFIDDPTRILRAVRFGERLKFTIEPRTAELVSGALPMLKRITGERLQSELTLILQETNAHRAVLKLEALGVLRGIHPEFSVTPAVSEKLEQITQGNYPDWGVDVLLLKWHILFAHLGVSSVKAIMQRLLMGNTKIQMVSTSARLLNNSEILLDEESLPSTISQTLRGSSPETLVTLWLSLDDEVARQRIMQYVTTWQHIKPTVDGNTLKQMGLTPGPIYREILERLQSAWIDDVIYNEEQEHTLLTGIIHEVQDGRQS